MKSLVPSMLRSLVEVDGEALVMHAGEKPYVVAPSGQVELANRPLSMEAVKGIVSQLLPGDLSRSLDEFGAVQHEIVSPPEFPGESFTVVAARGSDDMWVEIRRRKLSDVQGASEAPIEPAAQRLAIAATVRRGVEAAKLKHPVVTPPASPLPPPPEPIAAPPLTPANHLRTPQHDPIDPAAVPPALVLPMPRGAVRPESPPAAARGSGAGLDRLLRTVAARGASAFYLSSNAPPLARVDGEVRAIEGEPALGPEELESLLLAAVPDREYERLRSGLAVEWTSEVDGVGRVRCRTFQDQHGPGAVFHLPARLMSADRLDLPHEVQALALEPGGLVLVTGPRRSGKRTMIAALVDLMNRRRQDLVITIEGRLTVTHERGTSIVSQREVREPDDFENAARAALREDPDVLVIESLGSAALIGLALDAAASGQLVIGGLSAPDTVSAIDHIINSYPPETRRQAPFSLAASLRGIVAQVLLQKAGGGRVPAREILINTPAVARAIAEGRTPQLAGDAGQGMQRLNDALVGLVRSGAVDVSEAYRRAADRAALLARLKRLGVDTSTIQ